MSLFGTSPPGERPSVASPVSRSRGLFDDDVPSRSSKSLFDDDDDAGSGTGSPWDVPTPRRRQSRTDVKTLLRPADVPESYVELFDKALEEDVGGGLGRISLRGLNHLFAAARVSSEQRDRILSIVSPGGGEVGRNEFNVLLALIGLAQEGETVSLENVDERRKDLPQPKLIGINAERELPTAELAAKPPQKPVEQPKPTTTPPRSKAYGPATMNYPGDADADPWNTPDVHKHHPHHSDDVVPTLSTTDSTNVPTATNGDGPRSLEPNGGGTDEDSYHPSLAMSMPAPSTEPISYANPAPTSPPRHPSLSASATTGLPSSTPSTGGWGGLYDNASLSTAGGFGDTLRNAPANPFGGPTLRQGSTSQEPSHPRAISSGRTGNALEETVLVTLMPEKEGIFLFQHHNYEVSSSRRGSKVVRRYSDFVWLLECLHKRYPFRALPPLPPKRVAVNGNHLSNDRAFMEKRRRGLARFLNALVRHPILSQEQLVVMFLTVPTELAVWRKQATISVQEEFDGRSLPPGLEDSVPLTIEDLFSRSRAGIKRSAELYIGICSIMDRLVKRTEGVAADHGRLALSLASLTEATADTYATDTAEVALINDGLMAMGKHLRTGQSLLEDESRAWEAGVLEDLKRQRDGLMSMRDMFDRRDRLDRDNIPYLEKRITANEAKLATLRAKPEGMVKPGELEKVAESIIKDKESIVRQHNRSVFVRECIRDELRYFQASQYHVSRWNQDYAQERVKYAEVLADNWRRLLDELEGMPLGE
ncbi:hypothetical protein SAPIO_CDS2046 [Scedosporium apiospermum]|uniref:Sorting nexin MVP1 n=1 Tax=Pseudallescheria apiosperma TaxID=563466 RepID=A0A084GD46_PSEDA|nr:uncharacterized protein SAPIO_CDS2046 [Scedosporium apiospermum]KEZ45258.1 hypothetical protein SAPIO_CDS2046 [Scedosporium apiospermum]